MAGVEAKKPMIAFADPVFSKEARGEARAKQVAMRNLSSFYRGSQLDLSSLAESLPQASVRNLQDLPGGGYLEAVPRKIEKPRQTSFPFPCPLQRCWRGFKKEAPGCVCVEPGRAGSSAPQHSLKG